MIALFEDFSLFVYEKYAKKKMVRLKNEEWKFSTMTRELEGAEENVLYIGNAIKEIHWDRLEKTNKKHLCLDIIKRSEFQGEDVYEFLIHTNVLTNDEQEELTSDFVAYIKQKGMDEIIYVPNLSWYKGYVHKGEIFTTGEKSEELVQLLNDMEEYAGNKEFKMRIQTFYLLHDSNEYQIKLSPKNQSLRILSNNQLIVSIANKKELMEWQKQKEKQREKIKQLYQSSLELFKSRTKISNVELDQTGNLCLKKNDRLMTIIFFRIVTKIKKGKECFVISFGYKEYTASTYEKAEKKLNELITVFANEYRIRHLVGQN